MYLVLIAWLYVTLMMAVAEASSPTGTLLGAVVTFALYGLLPMGIVGYILGTPSRKRALRAREQADTRATETGTDQPTEGRPHLVPSGETPIPVTPDTDGHSARAAEAGRIPAVRKEP